MVAFNNQTICRDKKYFDKAAEFLPERWLKHDSNELRPAPNFVMLPFGYGPRMCIGRRFAEQEIYLAVIKVINIALPLFSILNMPTESVNKHILGTGGSRSLERGGGATW